MEKKTLHDLKTPLNAIMGYTEIVQEKLAEAGLKEYDDYLKKILDSSKKLLTLINGIEEGKIQRKTQMVDFIKKPIDMELLVSKVRHLVPGGAPSTFLVVEDDDAAREILCVGIKKAGWKAIEARNGLEALDRLQESIPSVVLLDLMMPEMDGFEVINEMRKNDKWCDIPVIIISAKILSTKERAILSKYSKAILQKGAYTSKDLMTVIREQIK